MISVQFGGMPDGRPELAEPQDQQPRCLETAPNGPTYDLLGHRQLGWPDQNATRRTCFCRPKSPLELRGALGFMSDMRQTAGNREPTTVEVPAFETDGNLLALLPRHMVVRMGRAAEKGTGRRARTDIKIIVVGEHRDLSVLAAQITRAWRLHEATGARVPGAARDRVVAAATTSLAASAVNADVPSKVDNPAIAALLARFGRALSRAAAIAGEDVIYKDLERPTDIGAVVEFLRSTAPLLSAEQHIDPQLAAGIACLEAEEALIQQAGGIKETKWVAEYLGITPKSVAAKARRNELLAMSRGDRNVYPAFQFKNRGIVSGVRELLEVLPLTNGWSRLSFLLSPDPGLDDRSPIEAFQTHPEAALEVARTTDTQGAARVLPLPTMAMRYLSRPWTSPAESFRWWHDRPARNTCAFIGRQTEPCGLDGTPRPDSFVRLPTASMRLIVATAFCTRPSHVTVPSPRPLDENHTPSG